MKYCPNHPEIQLPDKLTCPLCAQEARRAAYERQLVEMGPRVQEAIQRLRIAAAEVSE